MNATTILDELRAVASEEKRVVLARFFKSGPGEYGEGDQFLGVMVPQIRAVAKNHAGASAATEDALLASPWHEARECGLFLMCNRFTRADEAERAAIHARYLAAAAAGCVNNWDLVDLSAPTLVGQFLADKPRDLLYDLVGRPSLWENRIAIVSTLHLVRRGDLDDAFRLAERLLHHPHDLMHKAVGWVLRECGKRDAGRLRAFLHEHAASLPRTALRYAIERFDADERKRWLALPADKPLLKSFPPVARADAELLILGSMPGEESLRKAQYYAFPQNAFWRIAGALFGFDPALPYARRLAALKKAHVALWDVVGTCRREGSLDSSIKDAVPNDLPVLLARCPRLKLAACNGGAAYAALRRFFPDFPLPVVRLPSTSPAAARLSFARKLEQWRAALESFTGKDSLPFGSGRLRRR